VPHDLPIVDPHQHLWDFDRLHYGWLMDHPLPNNPAGDCAPIARPYGLDDYLADVAAWNVVGTVHVDAGAAADQALDETRWLQSVADTRGMPNGIVAYAALNRPVAEVDALLVAHCQSANVRGIRQIVNWHADPAKTYMPHDLLHDNDWRAGFARLARHDLSFDLQIYPSQMPEAARLAAAHPDTQLILNHAGMPTDRDVDGLKAWRDGMALLAAQPNVAVKISGLAMVDRTWTMESIRPFVLDAIALFGPDRAMFASNFPVDRLYGSFGTHFDAYDAITAEFTDDERRRLFGETAANVYRLNLP
jgi:predicted TIM-barrel fold metal-dependent hydrolase